MEENKEGLKNKSDVIVIQKDVLKCIIAIILFMVFITSAVWLCFYIGKRYDKNDNGGVVPFWTAVLFDPPELKINEEAMKKDPTKIIIDIDKKGIEYKYVIVNLTLYDKESDPFGYKSHHFITVTRTTDQITYQLTPEELLNANGIKCSVYSYYC